MRLVVVIIMMFLNPSQLKVFKQIDKLNNTSNAEK